MTHEEFDRWLEAHCAAFWSLSATLANDQSKVEAFWANLRNVEFSDAMTVTERMNLGEIERPYPEDHARAVRREAKKLEYARTKVLLVNERMGREERLDCLRCNDSGTVTIWDTGVVMEPLWKGEEPRQWVTALTRCGCRRGEVFGIGRGEKNKPVERRVWDRFELFDPTRHCQTGQWVYDPDQRKQFIIDDEQTRRDLARAFAAQRPYGAVAFT